MKYLLDRWDVTICYVASVIAAFYSSDLLLGFAMMLAAWVLDAAHDRKDDERERE